MAARGGEKSLPRSRGVNRCFESGVTSQMDRGGPTRKVKQNGRMGLLKIWDADNEKGLRFYANFFFGGLHAYWRRWKTLRIRTRWPCDGYNFTSVTIAAAE